MKPRAAIYHRVSTVDQRPELARHELAAAARRFGARVVLNIEETGSGASNDRPGLVRILDAARRGQIDVVLVWKLDRFGRSALDLITNLRALDTAGVRFIATTQGLDFRGDPISKLHLTVLAAVAEFERDQIIERTRLGLAKAKRDGKRLGRPRVARPPRAEVLKLIWAGFTWKETARKLRCTVWAARVAAKPAKKGGRIRPPKSPTKRA
jgi:putative DNA-invertase from lambdoid prophage Rac